MRKIKVRNILVVISIVIFCLGLMSSVSVFGELKNATPEGDIYFDGSNVSWFKQVAAGVTGSVLGAMAILYSLLIVATIWIVYFISKGIIRIIQKHATSK